MFPEDLCVVINNTQPRHGYTAMRSPQSTFAGAHKQAYQRVLHV